MHPCKYSMYVKDTQGVDLTESVEPTRADTGAWNTSGQVAQGEAWKIINGGNMAIYIHTHTHNLSNTLLWFTPSQLNTSSPWHSVNHILRTPDNQHCPDVCLSITRSTVMKTSDWQIIQSTLHLWIWPYNFTLPCNITPITAASNTLSHFQTQSSKENKQGSIIFQTV